MSANQLLFFTRIISVDSYMCDPVPGLDISRSEFRKSDVKSVPVVRVFGSTPAGQTTCLHLHGVFPYLMVSYCGPDVMESHWSEVERYTQQMATALDSALNSSSGKSNSNRQHVFKIVMLRGISFYGYHEEEELILKIYFYLPGDIKRSAELLQSGMVLDRQFQPRQAHSYISQLFLDYNLYGMNLLHVKNCWFRLPIGKPDPITELPSLKRPDDILSEEREGQSNEAKIEHGSVKVGKPGNGIQTLTVSHLRHFNWDFPREKTQSSHSQKYQQGQREQDEDLGDSDLPYASSSHMRITLKDEDSQASFTLPFSCSDLCKSLLSKTFLHDDITTLPPICPLHARWSEHNVPPASKLPTDVERHSTCDLEVDVIATDIANREGPEIFGTQRDNGPLDVDNVQLIPEDFARSQNMLKKQLSFLLSNSQHTITPGSPPGDTQPLVPPTDDDDDANGKLGMSQRWNSVIQDLLKDLSVVESQEDDGDDTIPQLDGASDELVEAPNNRLGSTKRSCTLSSKTNPSKCSSIKTKSNTSNAEENPSQIVNINASKVSDKKAVSPNQERRSMAGSDAVASSGTVENCTDGTANDAANVAKQSEISLNMQLNTNKNLPEDPRMSPNTGSDSTTNIDPESEAGDEAMTSNAKVEPAASCHKKKSGSSRTSRSSEIKDYVDLEKLRNLDEMVDNFVLVETGDPEVTGVRKRGEERTETGVIKETKKSGTPNEQACDSNVSKQRMKASKDTVLKRVESRTNVFTTILNENPGVTLYDETETKAQYTHSAVINLDSLPPNHFGVISKFNDALIKITSTRVQEDKRDSENMLARKLRPNRRCEEPRDKEKVDKLTRTRRPRMASKNSYLEDPIYETVFDSDWDSDESANFEIRTTSRPKRTKRTSNDYKRKRKSRQKGITKWIIVNRFKGMSNMKIGLWKIPTTRRVKLTSELIRLYELYSPNNCNIKSPPVKPPSIPTPARPRPMGKRSKHMLAILCPFGPNLETEVSPTTLATTHVENKQNEPKKSLLVSESSAFSKNEKNKPSGLLPLASSSKSSQEMITLKKRESRESNFPQTSSPTTKLPLSDASARESSSESTSATSRTEILKLHPPDSSTTKNTGDVMAKDSANKADIPVLEKIALDVISAMEEDMTPAEEVKHSQPVLEKFLDLDLKMTSSSIKNSEKLSGVISCKDAKNNPQNNPEKPTSQRNTELPNKVVEKLATQNVAKKILDKTAEIEICNIETSNVTESLKGAEDIMKTHPILTSMFMKTKQSVKKSERKKERSVKGKKEAKKKKSAAKSERNSPSPHDSDKDANVPRSIVPVSSRTVEPLCNRVSPELVIESSMEKEIKSTENIAQLTNCDSTPSKKTATLSLQKTKSIESSDSAMPAAMPCLEKVSPGMTDSETPTTSPVKKSSVILLPSTKKVYSPSRKVTRNSVAVKLNSICAPDCMFSLFCDDSAEPWPPLNALVAISFPSPDVEPKKLLVELPRPWSPKLNLAAIPEPQEEAEANEILEDFAESFGADATKMLGLVDDTMFKNMDCIDQLIGDNQITGHQKEAAEKTDSFSNLKEDSEKMLKHFDKIFEDVSSNAGAASKGSLVGKPSSSGHLDAFEEETLMEYIDEMTSPTQPIDPDPSQSHGSSYPLTQATPQLIKDVPTPEMVSPAVRDSGSANVSALPVLPTLPQPQKDPPQRPASTFPPQSHPNLGFVHPVGAQQQTQGPAGQHWGSESRPQSCRPGPGMSSPIHMQRPASALGHMTNRAVQSQPCLYSENQMKEIRKNMSPLNMFTANHGQSSNFRPVPERPDCSFYASPNVQSPSVSYQVPPPYPQMSGQYQFHVDSQGCTDPGQVPRPASVMDQPLQVFHTHVHHHHHVHSIDNQPSGSTPQCELGTPQQRQAVPRVTTPQCELGTPQQRQAVPRVTTPQCELGTPQQRQAVPRVTTPQCELGTPQQRQAVPLVTNIKNETPSENVKMESAPSNPWPTSSMATPERSRVIRPPEKPKSTKTQFYVPNSPFPYPKQPATPIQLGHQGLAQTLSYVETSPSQSFVSGKSNFYAFAGMPPGSRPQTSFSPSIVNKNVYSGIISILLKGSCQLEQNTGAEIPRKTDSGTSTGQKDSSLGRGRKTKLSWNPLPTLSTIGKQQTPAAKTPYGLMKQSSLNAVKNRVKPSKVAERKRKTISDFRAPPDTPTISLTGGVSGGDSVTRSEAFESSQDRFEKLAPSSSGQVEVREKKKTYSTYNFAFVSEEARKKTEKNEGKKVKLAINKSCLMMKSVSKNSKQRHERTNKRTNKFSESRSGCVDLSSRPVPRKGEELVLDPVTGNWEIAPVENLQRDVPVVFAPEEQILSKLKLSDMRCEEQRMHSGIALANVNNDVKYFAGDLPPIPKFESNSLKDDLKDFAVAKKKKKLSKIPMKRASSTPEYIVSSVDFESNSPRLKFTLKKTPPCRGKPQLSTLVTASDVENILPKYFGPEKANPVIIDAIDSSDDSDFNPSRLKKRKFHIQNAIDSGSDSDFQIEDASNSSTDDASEVAEVWSPGEIEPRSLDLQSHRDAVKNMYMLVARPASKSVLVDLTKSYIRAAVAALDVKIPKFTKLKKSAAPKKSIGPVGRSKSGRFVSLARKAELEAENKTSLHAREVADVRLSTDAPPPSKMMKIVPNFDSSSHGSQTIRASPVAGKGERPNLMQKTASCEEDDQTVIKSLLCECCTIVTSRLEQSSAPSKPAASGFCCSKSDSITIHGAVNDAVSRPRQGSDRKDSKSPAETDTLGSKRTITPNQDSDGTEKYTDYDPDGTSGPPNPNDGKGSAKKQSVLAMEDSKFIYRTVLKPPSKNEVISDIKTMKI